MGVKEPQKRIVPQNAVKLTSDVKQREQRRQNNEEKNNVLRGFVPILSKMHDR